MNDLQIIELYFARDERAIEETDTKYGKLCFRLSFNILYNEEDSLECVNDTYLSVWNQIPPTRPNSFKAFLCKITRNLSLKRLQFETQLKRNRNLQTSFEELEEILSDERNNSAMDNEELGRIISDFLRTEKEDARNVFLRKYWYFDSISDIAERYSFSESKVKSMLHQTRKRMKKYLEKEGIVL